jgi:adenylylsulfate kinase-like enzyme
VIIWFTGISGVGKTTIAKHLQKSLNNSAILIDGDAIRKINNNDLGYTKRDRDLNAKRMINLIEYLSMQKINIIVSANITSIRFRKVIKKKIKNFYEIHIFANMSSLLKRDYKKLYKNSFSKKIKNVVGVDIDYIKPKKCFMYLENNSSKKNFLGNTKFIIQRIKNLLK